MTETIYKVSELAAELRRHVEGQYGRISVRGEVSNSAWPVASGHFYCRLKDDHAVLQAVCWRSTVGRLQVKPQDGMEVIARGRLSIYGGQSIYQLVIEEMVLAGIGEFHRLYLERRKKWKEEGLFDLERKKPLPFLPKIIGIITSERGAVLHDMVVRIRARCPVRLVLYPVKVQGEGAGTEIAHAIRFFHQDHGVHGIFEHRPDVLIVARGGGSIEDLWAFNEEVVVRAIADATIPVISAVGHETDHCLSDDAADLRAPTPTAAAELATPIFHELQRSQRAMQQRLVQGMRAQFDKKKERWRWLKKAFPHPRHRLESKRQSLDEKYQQMQLMIKNRLQHCHHRVRRHDGAMARTLVRQKLQHLNVQQRQWQQRINLHGKRWLAVRFRQVTELGRLLEAHSYRTILKRGFVLIRQKNSEGHHRLVARKKYLQKDEPLTVEWHDGSLDVSSSKEPSS